jgi:hypothetical protein
LAGRGAELLVEFLLELLPLLLEPADQLFHAATRARSSWFSCSSRSKVTRSAAVMAHPAGPIDHLVDLGQQRRCR